MVHIECFRFFFIKRLVNLAKIAGTRAFFPFILYISIDECGAAQYEYFTKRVARIQSFFTRIYEMYSKLKIQQWPRDSSLRKTFFIVCCCRFHIVTSTVHFNRNSWLRAQRQQYAQRVSYICIYVRNRMNVTSFICIILTCIQLHRHRQAYAYSSNRQHSVA